MGWVNEDAPEHEGYLVAVVRDGKKGLWRELGLRGEDEEPVKDVPALQVACDCGWRSQRFFSPTGTDYHPYAVFLPDNMIAGELEEEARRLWRAHCDGLGDRAAAAPNLALRMRGVR